MDRAEIVPRDMIQGRVYRKPHRAIILMCLRVKSTFGTRGSQVQILPLRPSIQLILNGFL